VTTDACWCGTGEPCRYGGDCEPPVVYRQYKPTRVTITHVGLWDAANGGTYRVVPYLPVEETTEEAW
jgi:hypothetical protein